MPSRLLDSLPSPTLLALLVASLGAGFLLGYQRTAPEDSSATQGRDSGSEEEQSIPDGDLSSIVAGLLEPCKMVLIVRTDLKLNGGQVAEHCSRATLSCYKALQKHNPKILRHWERTGQAKIALKGKSEQELLQLEKDAKELNLCARLVRQPVSVIQSPEQRPCATVLAIGPGPVAIVNKVTGKLRLL